MPRLAGVDVPEEKKIRISLQYIYGVGSKIAEDILKKTNVVGDKRTRDLTADEVNRLQRSLDEMLVEGNLRRNIRDNIDRIKRIRSYRGVRHIMGLPVRGQRTRSNARTGRGKRRTVGSLTKEAAAKLEAAKTGK